MVAGFGSAKFRALHEAGIEPAVALENPDLLHDYKRHGTTTLFAALNVATGEVIGRTYRRHRHQEVLRFLREVEKTVPRDQEIHLVLDNYATHKHEKVLGWIERRKRVLLHFTPTSASWANLVERFFAVLTDKQIRRGVFTSVPHLERCLREYLADYNEDPRPFVWTEVGGGDHPQGRSCQGRTTRASLSSFY